MNQVLQINKHDNVVVALQPIAKGSAFDFNGQLIHVKEDIPTGHKISIAMINKDQEIIKYGYSIGHAVRAIEIGEHIHTHNIKTSLQDENQYSYQPIKHGSNMTKSTYTFQGYRRANGDVGIRNELWIVPTVGCVNGVAERIIQIFKSEVDSIAPFESIDVMKHSFGCSQLGDDHINTRTILKDIIEHPNAGGVLVLGLGCENNELSTLRSLLTDPDSSRVNFLVSQEVEDEIEAGVAKLHELHQAAMGDQRVPVPISELKIGLKCGGSDGFSGITANPLLGKFSDFLIAQGGSTVLTEVPEMFGAETILMNRAKDEQVFNKIVDLIQSFKQYFIAHDQPIYENPSPGNKDGGISTLEDKSLGCTQKAGTAIVTDVLDYGETLKEKGLNLLNAPGNDLVASTALAASGCHIVLFTTGRGTPFGTFVPTIKVSTNSMLANRKKHWIDFDAGEILEGVSMDEAAEKFIAYILQVAGGTLVNNEKNHFKEIAIFKSGVTL
ncbi:UxaA family hydrolase [Sporosarcina cascadiensis]|uniref:UxaA family hydrolase n=1 Tax=Sporosarcina cascadiensis TaxID=2660747 RepID=UPI00129B0727|nr:altronate dehydratase family protein [Sporosarcina cascadiensis]